MSLIDHNDNSEWLYRNGYKRRIVYNFDELSTSDLVIRFQSSTPYKLFDRQIKATSGDFSYEVIINPDSVTNPRALTGIIDQPLNFKVPRPSPFTIDRVDITGGEVVDLDLFKVVDKTNEPYSLPESDLQGRDFTQSQIFYIRLSTVQGNNNAAGIIRYILSETP